MKRRTNARATDKELYDLRAAGHSCREIAARYTPPLALPFGARLILNVANVQGLKLRVALAW